MGGGCKVGVVGEFRERRVGMEYGLLFRGYMNDDAPNFVEHPWFSRKIQC